MYKEGYNDATVENPVQSTMECLWKAVVMSVLQNFVVYLFLDVNNSGKNACNSHDAVFEILNVAFLQKRTRCCVPAFSQCPPLSCDPQFPPELAFWSHCQISSPFQWPIMVSMVLLMSLHYGQCFKQFTFSALVCILVHAHVCMCMQVCERGRKIDRER